MKNLWNWLLRTFGHAPAPKAPRIASTAILTLPSPIVSPVSEPGPSTAPIGIPVTPVAPVSSPDSVSTQTSEVPPNVPLPSPAPPIAPSPVSLPTPDPVPPVTVGPTFQDDFSSGSLDTSKWIPSNWAAPGGGIFSPNSLDFSQGCLRITVSQFAGVSSPGSITSIGGELQSKQKFGFGTYEWVMRASSTSPTPDGPGQAVSGQISSGFLYLPNSETEIDCPEIEGQHPNQLAYTSWAGLQNKQSSSSYLANPEAGFHSYKMVWTPTETTFLVDDEPVIYHKMTVPQAPAYAMINHWGTDSTGWGGKATPGVDRYMFVRRFSFTPA